MRQFLLTTLLSFAAAFSSASEFGPQPKAAMQAEILQLRERAWRSWFVNDVSTFRAVVPDELVAIGWNHGPWKDAKGTVQDMASFAKSGTRMVSLEFPHNVFQHYKNVIVLYSEFQIGLKSGEGQWTTTNGRATEIFVKRKGRWIHTGWHLDNIANQ